MTTKDQDLTRPLDLSHERRTGPQRVRRPIYEDLLAPCNNACPAGEDVQRWLSLAADGAFEDAWRVIMRDNPMPAVHGRVCYHPCESSCNRGQLDGSVSIHAIERFLGDLAIEERWTIDPPSEQSGKKVMIVGAGPSGLSAAYHLRRRGHAVTVYDAGPVAGGMMHFGIPAYRLPRSILDAETGRIEAMGVRFEFNHKIEDLVAEQEGGGFDAVFVAVGAHLSKRIEIPARDAGRVLDALSYLRDTEAGAPPKLGRRVAVYGGGNTAMDAARVARRLGHDPIIIYRRDYDHMPAHSFEADEAMEEGVKIHWLRSIRSMQADKIEVEVMAIDENGRPRPTGEVETIEADDLILALGQDTDTKFLERVPDISFQPDGTVEVDGRMMTGHPGIFAGGDMVPAERSVTTAVGHGKAAAREIDAWLKEAKAPPIELPELASFDKLNLWFYTDAAQRPQGQADLKRRLSSFDEVVGGLSEPDATFEARRCLSCGNCFECDGCYGACPENAIEKLGPGKGYRVKLDLCTGCAVCFDQCPCHAIQMIPEAEAQR
ncbi:MAG: NAD(P)-binding protein [Xanthomonadales bacterium]|nr:NAD(P)-binding protein [Xanthomonadales bacterium]